MNFFTFVKNNKLIILISSIILNAILLLSASFILYKYLNYDCPKCKLEIAYNNKEDKEEIINTINYYVEVKGAVKNPGVYKMDSNSIINDIVKLAGGFTKNAYTKNINLSRKITNELVLYVYTTTEYNKVKKTKKNSDSEISNIPLSTTLEEAKCECSTHDISNCIENNVSEIIASDKDSIFDNNNDVIENHNGLINVNTASKEELMSLTGIGESKANDIINYRNQNGGFKNIEDIKNVNGIGNSIFEKIKNNITV